MIGRRRLVRRISPGFGIKCRLCARVCSFDMNSPRSARLNAQVSTTCSPWVLMTVMVCPAATKAALPRRAGISILVCVILGASRSGGNHVDLDDSTAGKVGDAHGGASRTPAVGEVRRKDLVHPGVITF